MSSDLHTYTQTGKMRKVFSTKRIKDSWDEVISQSVIAGFKKAEISCDTQGDSESDYDANSSHLIIGLMDLIFLYEIIHFSFFLNNKFPKYVYFSILFKNVNDMLT